MQIKTTIKYHLTSVRMALIKMIRVRNVDKNVEKRVAFPVGGNATWCNHYVKLYVDSLETKVWATVWSSIYPFLGTFGEKNAKTDLKWYMHSNVHSSIICKSHKSRIKLCHLQ